MVNLQVDKPKPERELYAGAHLRVFWLALPNGSLPAEEEYAEVADAKVQACLHYIDTRLAEGKGVPKERMQHVEHGGVRFLELKAPPKGKRIYRLLCYQDSGWDLYVAVAFEKKGNELPKKAKQRAARRIKQSLAAGGP